MVIFMNVMEASSGAGRPPVPGGPPVADCDAYFYKTHGGAELDLLILRDGRRYGFEITYADAPSTTRSMHVAMQDITLHRLWVVYPGSRSYRLADNIETLPLRDVASLVLR